MAEEQGGREPPPAVDSSMEEERDPSAQDPPPKSAAASSSGPGPGVGEKGSPCEECGEQPWKYQCPGCSRLTCSLPCVQSHKRRTACSGKRPRTDPVPVPLSQFDDDRLLSDYNLLEETSQVRESAHRLISGFGRNFGGGGGAQLPTWLFFLRKAAQRRGVRLFFQPRGMTRREQNRSRHYHRKDCIYWTLEWRFNSTDIVLTDHEIDEHASLLSLLEKHLSPTPCKDQLTPYRNAELRDLKLFIQKSAKDSKSPYRQLNIEEPLRSQLRGILVVEYPTINVFLPSDSYDFKVENFVNKISRNEQPPGNTNDRPPLEGTEFHEEEIEEGELTSETQVIDLKDCGTSHTTSLYSMKVTSEPKIDSKTDSSVLSYIRSLALNQPSKVAPNTISGAPKTESCVKVYPLDSEERADGGSTLESPATELKDHVTSHLGNIAPVKGTIIPSTDCGADSSVPGDAQEEYGRQSKLTPNATPEAQKRKSNMKVYPVDNEEMQGLASEVPNLDFELDMKDSFEDLFGDMNPDDFLNFDPEIMDEDESGEIRSQFKIWDDLEEGEIPSPLW